MNLYGDYHTHTIFSHGSGTIEENVKVAIAKGLKEIAICDHGPGHYLYGVKRKNIPIMRDQIDRLNDKYSGEIKILLGVEANLIGFDGNIDVDDSLIKITDLLLLGYHYGITPHSFRDGLGFYLMNPISKILPISRKSIIELNTQAFIKAIQNHPIDFITHPGSKAKVDIRLLAKEAAKTGTALEINSKHSQLSVESIKIAMEENVDFIINSDAHRPEDVGNVQESIGRAIEAELPLDRIININKEG